MIYRSLVVAVSLAAVAGCDQSPASPTASQQTTLTPAAATGSAPDAGAVAATASSRGRQDVRVTMQDACDPDTFNVAIGPGTCVRNGGVSFDKFVAQVTRNGMAGAWHFGPPTANVQVGQTFLASNHGGEVHTFTEVAEFGGGIVPFLNNLAHTPTVAPECTALEQDDFVAPGGTYTEEVDKKGTLKFQCCIHPWMRLEASSR
jgi:plastocyanin